MDEEFTRRQAFLSERMEIEAEQAFQRQVRDLESELRLDMEQQLGKEEELQKLRIQEGLDERLAEREIQIRGALRNRLEQQLQQRLKDRETRLRAEYERRNNFRMEEDVAKDIQSELEQRLVSETHRLENRMQEDLELAVARKREELRSSVLKTLETEYSGRLSERKQRLRDRFDISFQQTVDDIEAGLTRQIEGELDRRIEHQFETYRLQREAQIGSQLARFRHDRENELRNEMEADHETRRGNWVEQIES